MKNAISREGGATAGSDMPGRWYVAPLVVLALGILAIGLLIWAKEINERQRMNFTLTKALMALQIKTATAHLRLEEALAEKDKGLMVEAFSTLDWAERLSRMILDGGVLAEGMFMQRLGEARLRKQAEAVMHLVSEFRTIAEERWSNPVSRPGSALDRHFDRTYNTIQQRVSTLEEDVEAIQRADRKKVGQLFLGILLAWSFIVVAATAGIWKLHLRRRDVTAALVTANERLFSQAEELRAHRERLTELVEARTIELTTANEHLRSEIAGHEQTANALQASEKQLRHLTARLMTAQEEERWKIASELHDELGHALTIVKLRLRAIERGLRDKAALMGDTEELMGYVDQVIEKVRRLSRELSPAALHVLGLTEALRQLADNFCRNFDCVLTLDVDDTGRLFPEDVQIMIYRVVQEVLTNIGKHAQAEKVSIAVRRNEDKISFVIEDDGQGFDLPASSPRNYNGNGMGLATMKERVLILDGSFDVRSQKGKGTRIAFDIPIPEVKP